MAGSSIKDLPYFLTEPIHNGIAYWCVRERNSSIMPNFSVATFSRHMPGAEREARELCAKLNATKEKVQ